MTKKVLILCPPNMTVQFNGPKGNLGDRIHQLPAVRLATSLFDDVFVWPQDDFTMGVFQSLNVKYISKLETDEIIQEVQEKSLEQCCCLFAEPLNIPEGRKEDAKKVEIAYKISQIFPQESTSFPQDLNPRGQIPLWKKLLLTIDRSLLNSLIWPPKPFFFPKEDDRIWALNETKKISNSRPVIIASPFSGKPDETNEEFWQSLAKLVKGKIIVPVHASDLKRAQSLFGNFQNVRILETDFSKMAALASIPNTHVIGIDGGPMNVLAASRSDGALAIYSSWPGSAWALPNILVCTPDITAKDALIAMP